MQNICSLYLAFRGFFPYNYSVIFSQPKARQLDIPAFMPMRNEQIMAIDNATDGFIFEVHPKL